MLDLAAGRHIERRQPGDDPLHTTVHLPVTPPDMSGLRPYERQVLERVRSRAVGGAVPISALTFRDDAQAKAWDKRLRPRSSPMPKLLLWAAQSTPSPVR